MLRNCILWNNVSPVSGTDEIHNSPTIGGSTKATDCNIQGGWSGKGNTDTDPLFVDPASDDYRLRPDSPCKNAGADLGPLP